MVTAIRTRILVVLALVAGLAVAINGQTPQPLYGKWALNLSKSTYDSAQPPYKKSTCKIEPWEDGLKVTYDMVGIRGGITHLEWTGRFDGRDYLLQGLDEVLTNAYVKIDDRTYEVVVKVDGARAATTKISISPDGKTLTTVTTARNSQGSSVSTTIYDRQ